MNPAKEENIQENTLPKEIISHPSGSKQKKYKNDELRDNQFLFDESELEFVVDKRFEVCLAWYVKNTKFYKCMFYVLMLISCTFPLIATLFNISDDIRLRWIVSLLSVAASISTAVLSLFRAQEKWTEYRSAAEYLKSKRALYLADINLNGKSLQKQLEFLELIEKYMEEENSRWRRNNIDEGEETQNG